MEMETERKNCKFWVAKKRRFCATSPLGDSLYCGNHLEREDGEWVPCPIDPSHSVLKMRLKKHVKKCPSVKQARSLSAQAYYKKGVNCGNEEGDEEDVSSELKRKAVHSMSALQFTNLLNKITAIHEAVCSQILDSYKATKTCKTWITRPARWWMPYEEKHALQQISILGNLEEFGVLKDYTNVSSGDQFKPPALHEDQNVVPAVIEFGAGWGKLCQMHVEYYGIAKVLFAFGVLKNCSFKPFRDNVPVVIEFGAGRGNLTQVLVDCYGINKVLLVERKAYKLKADRGLRKKVGLQSERLRIDIEDLNLGAVESLKGATFIAIGKHLCGPATDLTLRCCVNKTRTKEADNPQLCGLAVATCCHHLCQWKHYINKSYMLSLGINKEDFHALTWFTSWAVDAKHSSDVAAPEDNETLHHLAKKDEFDENSSGLEEIKKITKHDSDVAAAENNKTLHNLGNKKEFDENSSGLEEIKKLTKHDSDVAAAENNKTLHHLAKKDEFDENSSGLEEIKKITKHDSDVAAENNKTLHNLGNKKEFDENSSGLEEIKKITKHDSDVAAAENNKTLHHLGNRDEFDENSSGLEEIKKMSAADRAAVGFKCKDIIDMGRMMWIRENCSEAALVNYAPMSVSPENHLLLAKQCCNPS